MRGWARLAEALKGLGNTKPFKLCLLTVRHVLRFWLLRSTHCAAQGNARPRPKHVLVRNGTALDAH